MKVLKPETIQKYEGKRVRGESQRKYYQLFLQVDLINAVLHSVLEETRAANQQLNAELTQSKVSHWLTLALWKLSSAALQMLIL